jgi:hypothetical protein
MKAFLAAGNDFATSRSSAGRWQVFRSGDGTQAAERWAYEGDHEVVLDLLCQGDGPAALALGRPANEREVSVVLSG